MDMDMDMGDDAEADEGPPEPEGLRLGAPPFWDKGVFTTQRQGKAVLIQQGPYYRTLRMCSQDSVEEGVGGDDGMSDRQCNSPCECVPWTI